MTEEIMNLGRILLETNYLSVDQLDKAVTHSIEHAITLPHSLIKLNLIKEPVLVQLIASKTGIEVIDLDRAPVNSSLLPYLTADIVRKHLIFPVGYSVTTEGGTLTIATADPTDNELKNQLAIQTGQNIVFKTAKVTSLLITIEKNYSTSDSLISKGRDIFSKTLTPTIDIEGLDEAFPCAPSDEPETTSLDTLFDDETGVNDPPTNDIDDLIVGLEKNDVQDFSNTQSISFEDTESIKQTIIRSLTSHEKLPQILHNKSTDMLLTLLRILVKKGFIEPNEYCDLLFIELDRK